MTLTFVGTGSGKTSLTRFHSSILIDSNSERCLIDCGDGISRALLNLSIEYNSITSIIITHFHPDHFSGILTLLVNMRLTGRKIPINLYINSKLTDFLNGLILNSHLEGFKEKFPINIIGYTDDHSFIITPDFGILPRRNSHIRNKLGLENVAIFYSSSLLIKHSEKNIFYTSDIGTHEDLHLFDDKRIDFLISETTHVPVEDVFSFTDSRQIKTTLLTHIDNDDEKHIEQTVRDYKGKAKFIIAYDGLRFTF